MEGNVGSFLHRWARRDPSRTAILDAAKDEQPYSYAALDEAAGKVAGYLVANGLGSGDRVAICTDNGLEFVAAWFGAVYAGCTTLPVPAMSTEYEIAFRLEHAKCRALICDASHLTLAHASRDRAGSDAKIVRVDEAIEHATRALRPVPCTDGSLAMILYTSGTTGDAKGVCITHRSLEQHTTALVAQTLALTDRDRVLGTLPLTHSYGIRMTLLAPFRAGGSTVFVQRFSPEATLRLCAKHRVTWLPGVPTMFNAWAHVAAPPALPSLRWGLSAGAPLVEDTRLRAEARLGAPVRQGYGLTEATFSTVNAPPDLAVPGSVGKPVAGVQVRIADEGEGPTSPGEHGEVLIRGQNVMVGYLDDAEATARTMRGGWLHTGDIGFLDDAGRLTVVDRSKDLILRGGHSIYPFEIENALGAHPLVRDVAVVGRPDHYYGEEVVAVVVPEEPPSIVELDAWARERLGPHKVPRFYGFVETLPQGSSGKTLKRTLRERVISGGIDVKPTPSRAG